MCTWEIARHTDDGDRLTRPRRRRGRDGRGACAQQAHAVDRHRGVQRGQGAGTAAQARHVAQHVQPFATLPFRVNRHVARRGLPFRRSVACDALGGDPQAPDVHQLQRHQRVFLGLALDDQLAPHGAEFVAERGSGAACVDTNPRLQQRRVLAGDGLALEFFDDGTAGHDLVREEIGGTHQDADLHAQRSQRRGHQRHHRRRRRVMDTAGKQHLHRARVFQSGFEQDVDGLLPQHEAGAGTGMAAALAALEHQAARTGIEEAAQQAGRRHMQIGDDAQFVEFACLARAPAGDDGEWRPHLAQHRHLFVAQLARHEAEDSYAPRQVAHQRPGRAQQRGDLRTAQHGQGNERQRARLGYRPRKGRNVADAGHRPLDDGEPGAVRLRECCIGRQDLLCCRLRQPVADGRTDGRHDAAHGAVAARQRTGQGDITADGEQAVLGSEQAFQQQRPPVGPLRDCALDGAQPAASASGKTAVAFSVASHERGFRTVQSVPAGRAGRRRRLGSQPQLFAKHHAGRARQHDRRRAVYADAPLDPVGNVQRPAALLRQHERRTVADLAACFMAFQDHAIGPRLLRRARPGQIAHLEVDQACQRACQAHVAGQCAGAGADAGQQQDRHGLLQADQGGQVLQGVGSSLEQVDAQAPVGRRTG